MSRKRKPVCLPGADSISPVIDGGKKKNNDCLLLLPINTVTTSGHWKDLARERERGRRGMIRGCRGCVKSGIEG